LPVLRPDIKKAGVGKQRLPLPSWQSFDLVHWEPELGDQVEAGAPLSVSCQWFSVLHMSSLWTPGGERPVGREPAAEPQPAAPDPGAAAREPTEAEMAAQMEALRQQLAETPAEVVVANHAFGLFELAALHLSMQPPQLEQARVAIDAFAALVEGMAGRLGQAEAELTDGLAQLRMAFVQIRGGGGQPAPPAE
jgi:hypothetical protein